MNINVYKRKFDVYFAVCSFILQENREQYMCDWSEFRIS